ncbi:ABC transporter ATP-binding protein, partial [Rhizobium ruizarguesonis]
GKNTVSSAALIRATKPSASMALATAAGWGRGLFTLVRITMMAFRHPWKSGFAIGATLVASSFQLMIPRLLGRAVDHTQMAMSGG